MYESPIRLIVQELETSIREQQDKQIFEAIQKYGVDVDRDELIKALAYDRCQYDKGYADGRADARRWVSVEERLPISDEYVLCWYADENGKKWHTVGKLQDQNGTWNLDVYLDDQDSDFTVTHWMPLPEPPKEECK